MSIVKSFTNVNNDYGPVPVWQWKPDANLDQILATISEYYKHGITECIVDAIALDALPDVVKKPIYTFCQKNRFRFWLSLKEWICTKDSSLNFSTLRLIRYPVFENRVLDLAQYDNKIRALFLQKGDNYQYIPDVTTKDRIVLLSDEADQVLLFLEQPFDIPEEDKVDLSHYYEKFKEEIGKSVLGFFVEPVGFYRLIREIASSSNGKKLLWHDKLIDWNVDVNSTIQKDEIYHLWFDDPENISRHRVQYYLHLNSIFKKFYTKKIQEFCETKKIPIIGRFHFDEFLNESIQNYRHSDISAAVFSYAEKLTSSASWISNEKRTISETYAFSQWESTLQQMKANADWEYLKGIDKVLLYGDPDDPHVSKYSYWKYFSSYSDYVKRMGYVLSNSYRVCKVGVFYPIKTSYGLMAPNKWDTVDMLESLLSEFSNQLLSHQIDHNFINHDKLMEETLPLKLLVFCRCQCLYLSEIIRLQKFAERGGNVMFLHTLPNTCVNAEQQDAFDMGLATLLRFENVYYFPQNEITNTFTYSMNLEPIFNIFQKLNIMDIRLLDPDPNIHIVHRKDEKKHFYMIANTGPDIKNNAVVFPDQHKLEMWNAETGKVQPIRVRYHEKKDIYSIRMYPYESKLFVYDPEKEISRSSVFVFHNGSYNIGGIPLTVSGIPSSFILRGEWSIQFENSEPFQSYLSCLQQLKYKKTGVFKAIYKKKFNLPNEYLNFGLVIDLGDIRDNAEVFFNGQPFGLRCWPPYRYLTHKSSCKGENVIEIHVTGSISRQAIGLTKREGLLGPVKIIPYQAL